ncbi:MAG: hypothetical protein LBK65_09870 [Tannerellaceae bacterium]|jgi:hypothetical protein|nr:hypothetical protein [Tannerellaceae bacterium]
MKNYFYAVISLLFLSFSITAQEKIAVWDYPVKPGTEQWKAFTTYQEKVDACQIPEDVLSKLSTKELAEICMDYPLAFDFLAIDNARLGMRLTITQFNGLTELSKREEGTIELIRIYRKYPVLEKLPEPSSADYFAPLLLHYCELIISDSAFIDQLNNDQLMELGKVVKSKFDAKVKHQDVYSYHLTRHTFLLGAILLSKREEGQLTARQRDVAKDYMESFVKSPWDDISISDLSLIISSL